MVSWLMVVWPVASWMPTFVVSEFSIVEVVFNDVKLVRDLFPNPAQYRHSERKKRKETYTNHKKRKFFW